MHFVPNLSHRPSAWIIAVALVLAAAIALFFAPGAVSVTDEAAPPTGDTAGAAQPDFLAASQAEWERWNARGR